MQLFKQKPGTTFNCFSPPVMIFTFGLEISLMLWVFIKNRTSAISRVSALILFFLALFQLAEYSICEDLVFSHSIWSRVGFIAITALPVLGLHLIHLIAGVERRTLVWIAYFSAAVWFGLFATYEIFQGYGCNGNYVIFELTERFGGAFFAYYYTWLFVGIARALYFANKSKLMNIKRSLQALAAGYMVFIVPTTVVNLISPETAAGLPSIMCGFAVLFALMLALIVVPKALEKRN